MEEGKWGHCVVESIYVEPDEYSHWPHNNKTFVTHFQDVKKYNEMHAYSVSTSIAVTCTLTLFDKLIASALCEF